MFGNEETTTTTEQFQIVGELCRQMVFGHYLVVDPVDQSINVAPLENDMYEDVAGKIWKIV